MAQENSSHVAICNECKGNVYIRVSKDSFSKVRQCKHCNSEELCHKKPNKMMKCGVFYLVTKDD